MADLWSNVGAELAPTGNDWLYQKDGQVHGPISTEAVAERLLSGAISVKTKVAKEGGEFHPISQIAAFAPHLEELGKKMAKSGASKVRRAILGIVLLLGAAGAGGGYYFKMERDKQNQNRAENAAKAAADLKKQKEENKKILSGDVELVALVEFDTAAMTVARAKPKRPPKGKGKQPPSGGKEPAGEAEFMSQCKRSNAEIIGVLTKHLRMINFCVEDEKKRNAAGLPSMLKLSFVAKPTGSVGDFAILDRHYRTGPMRNCMVKAFRAIRFPPTSGTNCPVTIPIKIGG